MGQTDSCFSNQNIVKGYSISEQKLDDSRRTKLATFTKISPIAYNQEDHPECQDEAKTTLNQKTLQSMKEIKKQETKKSEKILKSTKGLNFKQAHKFLQKQNVQFKEDDEENGKQDEIQMKKVKVRWNDFIKMKKKKFTEDYFIIRQIGRGGFGCVYKVLMKNGKLFRAAKRIDKQNLKEEEHENLLGQMAIMMSLDHPNIAKLFEVYDQKNYYVMVMELCEGGQLFQRIVNYKMSEEEALSITKQVLSAIYYMHSKGIVHRDIKPENMLIEKKTKFIKLIDFGISTKISKGEILSSRVGTPYYIAPEVLYKKYNEKCDLWSIGVVIYMIFSGTPPFKGKDISEVMQKIVREEACFSGKVWKKFTSESIDFIKKLLTKNPKQRISAKKALNHPWIVNYTKQTKLPDAQKEVIVERMKNFRFKNKLEAVVHTYIVSQLLTNVERQQLLETFKEFDRNKNGVIEIEEIRYAINKNPKIVKANEEKIKKILDYIDTNCSGQIDYTQFMVAAIDFEKKVTKQHLEQAFSYFDIDNSGAITFEEISQFLDDGSDHIREIFLMVDQNGDGLISKEEFVNLLMKKK